MTYLIQVGLRAVPLAILWVVLTDIYTLPALGLGFAVGFVIMLLAQREDAELKLTSLPGQIFWSVLYTLRLAWAIFISALGVARVILSPKMPINSGIILVKTQDKTQNPVIAALSAHSITITPGEMVVNFDEDGDEMVMYVHCLDVEDSRQRADAEQTARLKTFRRMLGYGQ